MTAVSSKSPSSGQGTPLQVNMEGTLVVYLQLSQITVLVPQVSSRNAECFGVQSCLYAITDCLVCVVLFSLSTVNGVDVLPLCRWSTERELQLLEESLTTFSRER